MDKGLALVLALTLFAGCGDPPGRMEHSDSPDGPYREQIAAARHVLEKNEDWADRAEWEVLPSRDGWDVTAWRVEHPKESGAARYTPYGYSIIELDSRMVAIHYLPRK